MERTIALSRTVHREFHEICALLSQEAVDVLRQALNAHSAWDDRLTMRVEIGRGVLRIQDNVHVHVGALPSDGDWSVQLPLRWRPRVRSVLFPSGDATLFVRALSRGPHRAMTDLSLTARYRPGLGLLGVAEHAMILERLVTATAEQHLRQVAEYLDRTVPVGT